MTDLSNGEKDVLVRALRYYISEHRRAIQAEVVKAKGKDTPYVRTIKREAGENIEAAERLIKKLRPDFQAR